MEWKLIWSDRAGTDAGWLYSVIYKRMEFYVGVIHVPSQSSYHRWMVAYGFPDDPYRWAGPRLYVSKRRNASLGEALEAAERFIRGVWKRQRWARRRRARP